MLKKSLLPVIMFSLAVSFMACGKSADSATTTSSSYEIMPGEDLNDGEYEMDESKAPELPGNYVSVDDENSYIVFYDDGTGFIVSEYVVPFNWSDGEIRDGAGNEYEYGLVWDDKKPDDYSLIFADKIEQDFTEYKPVGELPKEISSKLEVDA